ncbi:MAG: hypothetical protein PHC61_00210 [Chitinivibrionales bacterium]|nr:hypothetical protein [Chitinivibrionales bacterium]
MKDVPVYKKYFAMIALMVIVTFTGSFGQWSRDASRWVTYLTNPGDFVGVGLDTPLYDFHLRRSTFAMNPLWAWPLVFEQNTASEFHIQNGGSTRFTIMPGGFVGINTTNPSANLDVQGNIEIPYTCMLDLNYGARDYGFRCELSKLKIYAGSTTPRMVILGDNGTLGVGTTSPEPAARLEVSGLSLFNGGQPANLGGMNLSFLQNSAKMLIGWNRTNGEGETDFITNRSATAGTTGGFAFYDIDNSGNVRQLVRMLSSGDMHVEGKIGARELIVTTGAWPDYVFKKDYKLKPLAEVEKSIQQSGHLEGIPSSAEATKKGVEVGTMQAKLLQKVEELTLYVIEQNKKIERQNGRIDRLIAENKLLENRIKER